MSMSRSRPARGRRPLLPGLALALASALALTACGGGQGAAGDGKSAATGADGCVKKGEFDAGTDYFPEKQKIGHAENFSLRYEKGYQVLTVKQPYPQGKPESYVLVKCGAPAPKLTGELAKAPQVSVPVKSLYSASTTHIPLLGQTGKLDVLTGVSSGAYVSDEEVLKGVKDGAIEEYAPENALNTEKVIGAGPDVLMTGGTDDPQYAKLRKAGIAVVANAEWLEATPLGRAEWVKAMAALTGAEKKAGALFAEIEKDYEAAAARAKGAEPVEVLPGSMYQGKWGVASGGSYLGRLLQDAGATHPWDGEKGTDSLQLSFEAVYAKAGDAPIWLTGENWETTADTLKADKRYGQLAAVKDAPSAAEVKAGKGAAKGGKPAGIWTYTKAVGPGGGNDYFESGVLRPDLVLADLVAILHPEQAQGHTFTYYEQVPGA
ncbi:ABC transporter substrate-binding protein [Streptomyces koyangensis]